MEPYHLGRTIASLWLVFWSGANFELWQWVGQHQGREGVKILWLRRSLTYAGCIPGICSSLGNDRRLDILQQFNLQNLKLPEPLSQLVPLCAGEQLEPFFKPLLHSCFHVCLRSVVVEIVKVLAIFVIVWLEADEVIEFIGRL